MQYPLHTILFILIVFFPTDCAYVRLSKENHVTFLGNDGGIVLSTENCCALRQPTLCLALFSSVSSGSLSK